MTTKRVTGRGLFEVMGAALLALVGLGACDEACLAQSDLFAGFREPLIEECCLCLAFSGTRFPGAACAEAVLDEDGVAQVPPDAGISPDAPFVADDGDRVVDGDEIPCLCDTTANQCQTALQAGAPIVVTGACIIQGTSIGDAPCGQACQGVLTFDPLTAETP